jgi:hypothetical protein
MMLRKYKYLLLLLVSFVLLTTPGCRIYPYPHPYPPTIPATGSIQIYSNPPVGAKIFLDGRDTGRLTPSTLTYVTTGSHILTLTLVNYVSYSRYINVIANQTIHVSITLTPISPPALIP